MADWYSQAPQNVERYNYYGWDAFAYDQGAEALNMTAMIFSHVSERRSSAYRMAAAAGFTDIELVGTLPYTEVDLEDLKARGEPRATSAKITIMCSSRNSLHTPLISVTWPNGLACKGTRG